MIRYGFIKIIILPFSILRSLMTIKYCQNCKQFVKTDNFHYRKDRNGFYAFCKGCMVSKGRSPDLPSEDERGGGQIGEDLYL